MLQRINLIILSFIILLFLTSGCATTQKGKILEMTAFGAVVGGVYGSTRPEAKEQNTVLYSSLGALLSTLGGLYYFDSEKEKDQIREENASLRNKLDEFERNLNSPPSQTLNGIFSDSEIPDEYKKLIRPGKIRTYKLNKWVKEGQNRLVLKSDVIEFINPLLIPNNQ